VAWHLAPALDNCGFKVSEVYSRNHKNASNLVKRLYHASFVKNLDFSNSTSQYFFISVPDDAIEEICREIVLPDNSVLIHTSGSVSLEALSYAASRWTGVFYPLQTFSKEKKVNFKEVPILVEGSEESISKELMKMAKGLSSTSLLADSDKRKNIHVAAVFASNFTNHMLTLSKEILEKSGNNFDLLKPLVVETLNKSLEVGPENAQTGPAKRRDFNTLEKHVGVLDQEQLKDLYRLISQDIVDHY